jgi:hypothetical protein
MSAKALFEFNDVIRVWIEFRAPKKGELMWAVPQNATLEEALDHVITGRSSWAEGEAGFGFKTYNDQPEFETLDADDDELLSRNIVVHVEHVRSEPPLNCVIPNVKLL